MPTSPKLLCAALAVGCVLSAPPARADPAPPDDAPLLEAPPDMGKVKAARHSVWMAYVGVHDPRRPARRPHRAPAPEETGADNPLRIWLDVEAGVTGEGALLGFRFGLDGQRWGIAERAQLVTAVARDGSGGVERLQMVSAHVTFSPLVGPRGRLRLEGGAAATHASASGATFLGPSVGLSFERCLFGALDVEGRGQWVPLPHLQLEGQLGLGLHLGGLTLHAGWRTLTFDDRGLVEGTRLAVRGSGPYAGVGLSF